MVGEEGGVEEENEELERHQREGVSGILGDWITGAPPTTSTG